MYSPACIREYFWLDYVLVSLVTFFGGLVILVPARIIWYFCRGSRSSPYDDLSDEDEEMDGSSSRACFSFRRMRAAAHELQSGNQIFSKIYVFLMFASNMGSVLVYLIDATLFVVECSTDTVIRGNTMQLVWLGLSAIQAIDYIVRFIAATDKLYVWLTLYSVVDHFTIVPAFYGYYTNVNWIGLRFLRLTYLLQIPDVLQVMHILKTHFKIRFVQCVSVFAAVWLSSSGFIHLCENGGDPHHNYTNSQNLTYWTTVYYTLVTMSTVGYGDYSPKTDIGKAFIVVYIIGSFAMFSSIVPELAQTFGNRSRYKKPFKRTYGKKHVIVCGHLAYESVCNFVRNFVHKDAESSNTSLVFVDRKKPTLELEAYFRRHSNDIVFYEGTIMNPQTLRNVKIESADACIILANRHTKDPDDEDAANIMRAAAVKTYCPRIRIIMQLLKVQSKKHLLNVPSWKWDKIDGDSAICLTDLKLSIMAQNCLTPGFSTLLSNLVINRSYTRSNEPDWTSYYRFGAGHEIYAEPLPESFVGMRFPDVAEICFLYANALLVGVDVSGDGARMALKLNPGKDTIIESGYIGYFIAQSLEDVRKAYKQRSARFEELKAEKAKGLTSTSFNGDKTSAPATALVPLLSDIDNYATITASQATIRKLKAEHSTSVQIDSLLKSPPDFEMRPMGKSHQSNEIHNVDVDSNSMFDVTGNFHWCQRKAMSECTISRSEAHQHIFKRHIVACVIAKVDTPPMGLFSFIMPLRASNYLYRELKPVIIIGDVNYIEKEWSKLENFPLIYVFNGDPLERADLDAVSINKCDMCVVLSSTVNSILVDETMLDREVLLATLNIRSMYDRSFEERKRSISAMCFSGMSHGNEYWTRDFAASREIPLTTVLESESSVAFLDAEHDNPDLPLYRTKLYMSGKVFATSTLDSLLSSTYLNGHVLNLFRALSAGAQVDEFEQILATASGITQSHAEHDVNNVRNRCRLVQLGLLNGPLEKIKHQDNYGQLLTQALHTYGILCLGVFRLIDPSEKNVRRRRRFVITNPAGNFKLLLSDLIFALQPFPYSEVTITKSSSVGRFNVESSEQ